MDIANELATLNQWICSLSVICYVPSRFLCLRIFVSHLQKKLHPYYTCIELCRIQCYNNTWIEIISHCCYFCWCVCVRLQPVWMLSHELKIHLYIIFSPSLKVLIFLSIFFLLLVYCFFFIPQFHFCYSNLKMLCV